MTPPSRSLRAASCLCDADAMRALPDRSGRARGHAPRISALRPSGCETLINKRLSLAKRALSGRGVGRRLSLGAFDPFLDFRHGEDGVDVGLRRAVVAI